MKQKNEFSKNSYGILESVSFQQRELIVWHERENPRV